VLLRVLKLLFKSYPVLVPIAIFSIIFGAVVAAIPSIFMEQIIAVIEKYAISGDYQSAAAEIIPKILILAGIYIVSIIIITAETQLSAYITQGFLCKMRGRMFDGMQNLPIRYFDTKKHGDIMSYYTNDVDTLRQLISQSLPTLLRSGIIVLSVLFIMLYYSVWLTLVLLVGVCAMLLVSKKLGGAALPLPTKEGRALQRKGLSAGICRWERTVWLSSAGRLRGVSGMGARRGTGLSDGRFQRMAGNAPHGGVVQPRIFGRAL